MFILAQKYLDMYSIQLKEKLFEIELNSIDSKQGTVNGKPFKLDINTTGNKHHVLYNNVSYRIELDKFTEGSKEIVLKVNNDKVTCQVSDDLDLLLKQLGMDNLSSQKMNDIKAPMPGMVLNVLVEPGQTVNEGDTILVLEAMKMENNIKAHAEGVVKEIVCKTGNAVEKNDVLIVFE